MVMTEKEEDLFNNYVYGNIGDFRKGLKKLTKVELLEFIQKVQGLSQDTKDEFLNKCLIHLR